ncbi:MAG TPA: HDOD domain-containing protein, partial [Terriglobales bacterium]
SQIAVSKPAQRPTRFLGRQPILDRDEKLFGYELLFRDGMANYFAATDVENACLSTLDSSLLMGLDLLCGGAYASVNCTRDVLLSDYVTLLPPQGTIVEVLETVTPDDPVVAACRRLKQAGYLLALDDFTPADVREPLTPLADIIKVDVLATPRHQWRSMVDRYAAGNIRMLAEKVETRPDFDLARDLGFSYFQGYFFQKPVVLATTEVPSLHANYIRMLRLVHATEIDWRELEGLIKREASVCYRLLRYLNSPVFGFVREIRSVRHALSMLGEREIRKWISLVAVLAIGKSSPSELVHSALTRAHFCELLSDLLYRGAHDCFLLGLFSLMDAILGMPMPQVLERVPVEGEIKAALLGRPSRLQALYGLVLAQESGDWERCSGLAAKLQVHESKVARAYLESVRWARQVMAI